MWWLMVLMIAVPMEGDGPGLQGPYTRDECFMRAREWNHAFRAPVGGVETRTVCLTANELQVWRARMTPPTSRNRG